MKNQAKCVRLLVACLCLVLTGTAGAMDLVQPHPPLALNVGLGGWGYDTGWLGVGASFGGVWVQLALNIGGTVLDVSMDGQGQFSYPTGVNQGDLSFLGTTGGGYASQDLGIQISGKYKITIAGNDYTGDLPYIPNTDVRLSDTQSFTPYQLGESVTLSDNISAVPVYTWNIGVKNLFSGDIGVSLTGGDEIKVNFESLQTDKADFTADGQSNPVPVTDSSLTVGDIRENISIEPTMTLTPNIVVGITVLYIPYHFTIPTFPIDVPLKSLINPKYATTPSQSITFQLPPNDASLAVNNGAAFTGVPLVSLNNTASGAPTDYMASENADFSGAAWQAYSSAPTFMLSAGDGVKTVYFKTKNAAGESAPTSDTITLDTSAPIGTVFINNNRSVTNSLLTTLTLTWDDGAGSGVGRMRFSDDGAHWTAWMPLAATLPYTLPAGEGHHTVRVQFLDKVNNRSVVFSDFIRVDMTPPTGSVIINNGALSTKSSNVTLGLTWADNVAVSRMRFSDDGMHWTNWEMLKTPRTHTLPAGLGYRTVRVQYLDAGNNYSPVYNDYIKVVAP